MNPQGSVLIVSNIELNQSYITANVDNIINKTGFPQVDEISDVFLCRESMGKPYYIELVVTLRSLTYKMTVPLEIFTFWFKELDAQLQAILLTKSEAALRAVQQLGLPQKSGVQEAIAMVRL